MFFNDHLCNHNITTAEVVLEHVNIWGIQFCDHLHCRSNRSINYTVWTDVRLFVNLIRAEWKVTNLF